MDRHEVQLRTIDAQVVAFDCGPDESVVEAARSAGYTIPSMCEKGTCGGCVARVTDGDYALGEHAEAALPRRGGELVPGGVLLCRTNPQSTLSVDVPYERSRIIDGTLPLRQATISAVTPVADGTVRVELQLEEHPELGIGLEFEPGQFFEVNVPGTDEWRAYSLANSPNWDGQAELLIHLRPNGAFSTWLAHQAQPGDELILRGPQGAFGLRDNGIRPRWFVAGGMGLAPVLSMMRRMAEWQEPHPVHLFLGVTTEHDVPELPEITEAGKQLSGFGVTTTVWRPTAQWNGVVGTPVDALSEALDGLDEEPDIYACGPPAMVDAAGEVARDHGIGDEHIVLERYLPSG